MSSTNLKYYSQLDGLRCFAIVSVMIGHWIAWSSTDPFVKNVPWSHGVILFFVLSGYLISNILLEQKETINSGEKSIGQSLRTFYVRRAIRIFPIYYLLIIYLYSINFNNTREIFPWLLTYTTNFLMASNEQLIGSFNHFWSLAIEEQFYLIWPFVVFFVPNKHLLKTILGFMIFSFVSRVVCHMATPYGWTVTAYFTPNLFLPLCLGALLAYAKRYNEKLLSLFTNNWCLYGSIIFYTVCYYILHTRKVAAFDMLFDEYMFAFMCVFIIAKASTNGFKFIGKRLLEHDITVFTGKISYGLYVYHLFIGSLFWDYIALHTKLIVGNQEYLWIAYFAIAFILAIASYYFIERPINGLKKYSNY